MGSVAPPFILCPLSDSKELVGIHADQLENRVIVTLGKNIAIRYHVLEQKQEASWTCSRHWFTSPVVFCSDFEKYGAIIDNFQVVLWDENDAHLVSRKKYKFTEAIHLLRPTTDNGTLIIFNNGTVRSLSEAIANRSAAGQQILDESTESIVDVVVNEKASLVFLVSGNKPTGKLTSKCGVEKSKWLNITTIKIPAHLKRDDVETPPLLEVVNSVRVSTTSGEILGGCVVVASSSFFVYLCSDGYLYRQPIEPRPNSTQTEPTTKVAFLDKLVSIHTAAVIRPLDSSTVIVYGADPSEEGATVFIYDINYDLMLSKQSLKLFGSPTIMFTVGNHVFVPVGLHVLVLAVRQKKSLLSSLVGKHQIQGVDFFETRDPWSVKAWEGNPEPEKETKEDDAELKTSCSDFEELVTLANTLACNGQPQSMICEQIIPKILENGSSSAINWVIGRFCDIPEYFLVRLLTFQLAQMEKTVRKEVDAKTVQETQLPTEPDNSTAIYVFPRNKQVDRLLNRPFDQRQMIHSLRAMDFQMSKKLLEYLQTNIEPSWDFGIESDGDGDMTSEISQMLKWTCTILDTHYPQFVFHDETAIIDSLLTVLKEKFVIMNEIEALEPLLTTTMHKTSYEPGPSPSSKYSCTNLTFHFE